jgi:hypothetical protein
MSVISPQRLGQIKSLVTTLPDGALRTLDGALSMTYDAAMIEVRQLIVDERQRRKTKSTVFAPFMPLFEHRADELNSVLFPGWLPGNLWRALQRHEPELVAEAQFVAAGLGRNDPTPVIFFRVVTAAAELLRTHSSEILPPHPRKGDMEEVLEFAEYLDLHRIVVDALIKLPDWLGRIDADKAAALRVLYKDACNKSDDSGARFMEVLFANLDDGVQIMKLIGAVVDKNNDRFLAESELADFGGRVIERIEESIQTLRQDFDKPFRADTDPHAAGVRVAECLALMHALEQAIELSRDGPWGQRVSQAHKVVAVLVEGRLKLVDKAVSQALPTKASRGGLPRPRMDKPLVDMDLQKARAQLTFMRDVRLQAQHGGYATLHGKTVQAVELLLTSYFEDLLWTANSDEAFDVERLEAFFAAVLDLIEAGYGEERSGLARRRIASTRLYRVDEASPDGAVNRSA